MYELVSAVYVDYCSGQLNIHDFEEYFEESDDSDFEYPVTTVRPPRIPYPLNAATLNVSKKK